VAVEPDRSNHFRRFVQVVGTYPVGSLVWVIQGKVGVAKQIRHHTPLLLVAILALEAVRSGPRRANITS